MHDAKWPLVVRNNDTEFNFVYSNCQVQNVYSCLTSRFEGSLTMIKYNEPLTIFVVMPGTEQNTGGQSIPWLDPEDIKTSFFEKVALKLKQDLRREIILHIETDKHLATNVIHNPSFVDSRQPPIYIIDLTGNNANIYLDLGMCLALKDNITVLVSQNITDVKFSATYSHVIPYSNDPDLLEQAIECVTQTIKRGLANEEYIDSPVRSKGKFIVRSEINIKAYHNEIHLLMDKSKFLIRGQEFLDRAKSASDPDLRMRLYQNAIHINPALQEAYLPLAEEQRKQGLYEEALVTLKQAISLFPTNAKFYREQGLAYSKSGRFERAIESFRTAVTLNDRDEETWATLGGLLRRIGTRSTYYNWDALRESRDSYQKALELNDRNTYAQGNLARLDLILSKIDPERLSLAICELDTLELLSRLDLKKNPKDYWRWFDWADSCLLSGKVDQGYRLYTEAIKLVPQEHRKSELSTVILPLTNLLLSDVLLDDSVKAAVQKIIEDLWHSTALE